VLDGVIAGRGKPQVILCDNGRELTSRTSWPETLEWQIELRHIQPGKPTHNAHIESFHGQLQEECLRVSWFTNLFDAEKDSLLESPFNACTHQSPDSGTQRGNTAW
jgi:putative transposase